MENIIVQGPNTIKAHLLHLKEHGETGYMQEAISVLRKKKLPLPDLTEGEGCHGQCPGSAYREIAPGKKDTGKPAVSGGQASMLRQWPVQLTLLPVQAPIFSNAHLLISADCVAYANPNFHPKLLYGKALAIACPKLDDLYRHTEKLTQIFKQNDIKSITVAIMEVPCCAGLHYAVQQAIKGSGKNIPLIKVVIGIDGNVR
jgi:hypothetical protein